MTRSTPFDGRIFKKRDPILQQRVCHATACPHMTTLLPVLNDHRDGTIEHIYNEFVKRLFLVFLVRRNLSKTVRESCGKQRFPKPLFIHLSCPSLIARELLYERPSVRQSYSRTVTLSESGFLHKKIRSARIKQHTFNYGEFALIKTTALKSSLLINFRQRALIRPLWNTDRVVLPADANARMDCNHICR
jgi:hypothetical protein